MVTGGKGSELLPVPVFYDSGKLSHEISNPNFSNWPESSQNKLRFPVNGSDSQFPVDNFYRDINFITRQLSLCQVVLKDANIVKEV